LATPSWSAPWPHSGSSVLASARHFRHWRLIFESDEYFPYPMGFTYDFYAYRWHMCSISYYFRNSSASINNVNYDIDLQTRGSQEPVSFTWLEKKPIGPM
jgi:hypothetical protein